MPILFSKPMKFECTHCDKTYLAHYRAEQPQYPHRPHCHQAGLLLGLAEIEDFIRLPFEYASAFVKQTWHKRGKSH